MINNSKMILNQQKRESIKSNLFFRSQDAIPDYNSFDWHNHNGNIDSDKPNSSQAIAIDFWGCLKLSPYKDQLINLIFNQSGKNWNIIFEYTDRKLLSEPRPTQIDIIVANDKSAIVLECKFTEIDGGHCSQIKKTKKGLIQCDGCYTDQINPTNNIKSKCALTGKGIKYWDYIDLLTKFKKNDNYRPCPIKGGEYQWIRNICFAEAYSKEHSLKTDSYLIYYKSDKCPISIKVENNSYLGNLKGNLLNAYSFRPLSYNELLVKILIYLDSHDKDEKKVWVDLQKWMIDKLKKI